ncbi:MAG: hypothetical protein Q8M49_15885 [Limnobacter sp.]|nr:hypothetical protein [Limnobacter sp.]
MYRSLRKGHTSIYFQHQLTGHNIGAELFEFEIAGKTATLRLQLRPVDQNQRDDELYLGTNPLISVTVNDSQVVNGFTKHVRACTGGINSWRLLIVSRGQTYSFSLRPSIEERSAAQALVLEITASGEGVHH